MVGVSVGVIVGVGVAVGVLVSVAVGVLVGVGTDSEIVNCTEALQFLVESKVV